MAFKKGDKNINKNGRPKGATTRPQLRDYHTEDEIKALVADLKKRAKTDDGLFKFQLEQVFGKAPQALELTGKDGEPLFNAKTKEKADEAIKDFLKEKSTGNNT